MKKHLLHAVYPCSQRLLERRQIRWASALRISSSRKSGWASSTMLSARSQVVLPTRLAMPYSVTIY